MLSSGSTEGMVVWKMEVVSSNMTTCEIKVHFIGFVAVSDEIDMFGDKKIRC